MHTIFSLLLILQSVLGFRVVNKTMFEKYCELDPNNTPCLACGNGSETNCFNTVKHFEFIPEYTLKWMVRKHNIYRNSLKVHGLPKASNMQTVSWDLEAEFFAICQVLRLLTDHDKTSIALSGEKMGQNVYYRTVPEPGGHLYDWFSRGMHNWMQEMEVAQKSEYEHFCTNYSFKAGLENFSQLLWANTKFIGCAYYHKEFNNSYHHYVFCNYRPAGNIEGEKMFESGEMKCNANGVFKNLCGSMRPLHFDPFRFPLEFPARQHMDNAALSKHFNSPILSILLMFCNYFFL